MGVTFITLRRRSPKVLAEIRDLPALAWRRIRLDVPARKYRAPLYLSRRFNRFGVKTLLSHFFDLHRSSAGWPLASPERVARRGRTSTTGLCRANDVYDLASLQPKMKHGRGVEFAQPNPDRSVELPAVPPGQRIAPAHARITEDAVDEDPNAETKYQLNAVQTESIILQTP